MTDLQENGWDADARAAVPDTTRIEVADVGPPPPNFAVTALRSEDDRIVVSSPERGGGAEGDARVAVG